MRKPRTWPVERRAAVRWLRWQAEKDHRSGNEHEAGIIRRLAEQIEKGRHVMEGPPDVR